MNSNIFQNASIKLTVIYLTIIMFISLVFSIGLYRVSAQEIERGIRLPDPFGRAFKPRTQEDRELFEDFQNEQEEAIKEAQARIISNLILINIIIFVSGGIISYYLARRTLEPIEQAHEAQSRFTADASHELRTPIAAMRIENELSLTDSKLTLSKAREQLKSNIEELDKLTDLSEGLLQLARLDNNDLEKDDVSIAHIIQQAAEQVATKAEQKSQTITTKKVVDEQVKANQPAIIQALVVLIDNAIKYSPEKSEITIRTKKQKGMVAIQVVDSGTGIRAVEIPHIFDRFYRADTSRSKENSSGYGIGLSIAKAIVDLHGGKISVKSIPEKGSTFTISLPN